MLVIIFSTIVLFPRLAHGERDKMKRKPGNLKNSAPCGARGIPLRYYKYHLPPLGA
jgi:hypothetical protein